MRPNRTQFSARAFVLLALLLASAAPAQLVITSGGRRVFDRDPDSADGNCLGWTYGASPAFGANGELVGMYTASDALMQHCPAGATIDDAIRFGDAIQFHALRADGSWSAGQNVIDRSSFEWMSDASFLANNPQTFTGHVASPSVVQRDGRSFMAFTMSRDDRNLCAGEHYAGNVCGSCLDPWSYFVAAWAVSDDGITWRIRERAVGDPTFIGRPPSDAEKTTTSNYKGLTRVSMLADGGYFYIAAQYWARSSIRVAMFRVAYDAASEWGTSGEPEAWSPRRRVWEPVESYLDDPLEYNVFNYPAALGSIVRSGDRFYAFNPDSNRIIYQTSTNLVDWTPALVLRSAIPFLADGFGYDNSVIDPVAVSGADGKLHLFFASADGDPDHGIPRDGLHDCGLYSNFGPTAVYLGTGIYEVIAEPRTLRTTLTSIGAPSLGRFAVRVTAFDGSTPSGNVVVRDSSSGDFRIAPLVNGVASIDLPLTAPGDHVVFAWFDAQGDWDASRSAGVIQHVPTPARRRAAR
jgi:hypothetical protein